MKKHLIFYKVKKFRNEEDLLFIETSDIER